MMASSPASSAVAVPSSTSVLVPEIGASTSANAGGRGASGNANDFGGSAGRGADHDRPGAAGAIDDFVEQRVDLFAAIDGNDDRS